MRSPQPQITGAIGSSLWRLGATALMAVVAASLVWIASEVIWSGNEPVTLIPLVRLVFLLAILPALGAWWMLRSAAATIEIRADELVLHARAATLQVPSRSIARILPWRLPLPAPGFGVRLRSGRRLGHAIVVDDPEPLLRALADVADCEAARAAAADSMMQWAHARAAYGRPTVLAWILKYGVFAILPAAIFFNAHQHISFGGLFGQWNLQGFAPWLATLVTYWLSLVVYLLVFGGAIRIAVEGALLLHLSMRTGGLHAARRWGERTCVVLYYAGVPALVGLRFLDW